MRREFLNEPPNAIWDLSFLCRSNKQIIAMIREMISTYGVFCYSVNKDHLLIWSHYADHHRGIVLELRPDTGQDSALLDSRAVRYSDERPLLYRSPRDMLEKSLLMSKEASAKAILEPLIYTKSTEWEYEQEYRLAIPRFIPKGASESCLSLYPEELSSIYFGCRMTDEQRIEIKALARSVNPYVRFRRAVMAERKYGLEWVDDDSA
jgi:Protein of unknown function (DUF2971)